MGIAIDELRQVLHLIEVQLLIAVDIDPGPDFAHPLGHLRGLEVVQPTPRFGECAHAGHVLLQVDRPVVVQVVPLEDGDRLVVAEVVLCDVVVLLGRNGPGDVPKEVQVLQLSVVQDPIPGDVGRLEELLGDEENLDEDAMRHAILLQPLLRKAGVLLFVDHAIAVEIVLRKETLHNLVRQRPRQRGRARGERIAFLRLHTRCGDERRHTQALGSAARGPPRARGDIALGAGGGKNGRGNQEAADAGAHGADGPAALAAPPRLRKCSTLTVRGCGA
mmetsp:Transcript_21857/g.61911  ORF Transcript_21857/g.61911 Transcript_21857/m.61911 type:complete len:276 (+) Transcript_21857:448-1275(+)